MSIPYNPNLSLDSCYKNSFAGILSHEPSLYQGSQVKRAAKEAIANLFKEPVVRGVQLLRDAARLVLKVPIRAIFNPIFLEKNWRELERAKVNAKLTGYAFIQLASVPVKFAVALAALTACAFSQETAKRWLDGSYKWTAHFDGRASQLEALKEEGAKKSKSREEFETYKAWLYRFDPSVCRKVPDSN